MVIPFVEPRTCRPLTPNGAGLVDESGNVIAPIVGGIPRFVEATPNYADSFGWQWNTWHHVRSQERSNYPIRDVLMSRFHFDEFDLAGKSILECGCGGGDDTEVLLQFPFAEIHAFDLSNSVERAANYLTDQRLVLSQASIYEIPYADRGFDFVFCHRVLQHTPDPAAALRAVCRKVKLGGVLFAHSYKRCLLYMMRWKYKYRWLTKRLPKSWIYHYLRVCGPTLNRINRVLYRNKVTKLLAYNLIPFAHNPGLQTAKMSEQEIVEFEKLNTFDALTPWYDNPMTTRKFLELLSEEGFEVNHLHEKGQGPICVVATHSTAGIAG